jgi:hypothetical protein
MFPYLSPESGLVRTILIILIAVLVLAYFGIDLRAIVSSPTGQSNLTFIKDILVYVWQNFLARPVMFLWNDVFVGILWETFKGAMDNIKTGEPTELQQNAPNVDLLRPAPQP